MPRARAVNQPYAGRRVHRAAHDRCGTGAARPMPSSSSVPIQRMPVLTIGGNSTTGSRPMKRRAPTQRIAIAPGCCAGGSTHDALRPNRRDRCRCGAWRWSFSAVSPGTEADLECQRQRAHRLVRHTCGWRCMSTSCLWSCRRSRLPRFSTSAANRRTACRC